ncbi:hypothetical protein CL621_04965 [archaeon]|nr:hypothetical protein [archaeon]
MKEEQIKQAFSKVKQDISFLSEEISNIKTETQEIKTLIKGLHEELNNQKLHEIAQNQTSTLRHITSTDPATSTVPQEIEGLNSPNLGISIGNQGASTDRQTLRQTDRQQENEGISPVSSIESNIQKASDILDSLDQLKKEIRLKFKRITAQEMSVFSTIYLLEEQNKQPTTYRETALKLGLSESSIRDYVQRMINKGIPVKKQRVNNRQILLSISKELKKIATLSTIIKLRAL